MQTHESKIVLLGEGRVGKSSILIKYIENTFDPNMKSTTKAGYMDKTLNLPEGRIKLFIWDTAGQEMYHALSHIYYRDADGAFLVYDITDSQSFAQVQHWIKELKTVLEKTPIIIIAGNKYDCLSKQKVSKEDAENYAEKNGAHHFYTSAKTGFGIVEAFQDLATRILKNKNQPKLQDLQLKKTSSLIIENNTVTLTNQKEKPKNKKDGCC
ncbi:ras-related protein rab-5c [Anaeramoeba ignava]|uniref:Ras-related protein rab-5c n=1 Tax=Anaeramoeba ignava TaxID=1746090 RepID=A0A9Q0RH08_ANAIG|nr:ras-related protein rab-5c [Anaeramoeba ignava]